MDARASGSEAGQDDGTAPGSRLVVALVRSVHGLRGAVRVEVLTDRPEVRFARGAVLHPEGSERQLTIAAAVPVADGPGWRLHFAEIPDRSAAEALRGAYLEADPTAGTGLGSDQVYWHEVVGVTVRTVDGTPLGVVRDVYRAGGAEVYVVRDGPVGEFDVPAVRAFIRVFDPRNGEIVVDADALDLRLPQRGASRG